MATENISKGITKFTDTCYRAVIFLLGKEVTRYFKTLEEANEWYAEHAPIREDLLSPGGNVTMKQTRARTQDLPIGTYESFEQCRRKSVDSYVVPIIRTTICLKDGGLKHFQRSFDTGGPRDRTREEAVKQIAEARAKFVEENPHLVRY